MTAQSTDSQIRELQALLDNHERQIAGARKSIARYEAQKVHPLEGDVTIRQMDALIARAEAVIASNLPHVASLRRALGLPVEEGQADEAPADDVTPVDEAPADEGQANA